MSISAVICITIAGQPYLQNSSLTYLLPNISIRFKNVICFNSYEFLHSTDVTLKELHVCRRCIMTSVSGNDVTNTQSIKESPYQVSPLDTVVTKDLQHIADRQRSHVVYIHLLSLLVLLTTGD